MALVLPVRASRATGGSASTHPYPTKQPAPLRWLIVTISSTMGGGCVNSFFFWGGGGHLKVQGVDLGTQEALTLLVIRWQGQEGEAQDVE